MRRLIYHRIQISSKPVRIHTNGPSRRICYDGPGHEPSRRHGPKLGHWHAIPGHDNGLTGLNLSQHCRGLIAKLPLRNCFIHGTYRSTCLTSSQAPMRQPHVVIANIGFEPARLR
jgi:hypothetical protein